MKRRSFLRGLIASVCMAPVVCRLAEKVSVEPPKQEKECDWVPNPDYENAEYEIEVLTSGNDHYSWSIDPDPLRYIWDQSKRMYVPI